ncbi:MAG: hypothetical protein WCO66_01015 [Candidatus Absconditabacteria bacterium]
METQDAKLDLLHNCLLSETVPQELPNELPKYETQFNQFKDAIKDCQSSNEVIYLEALTILRDQLLEE